MAKLKPLRPSLRERKRYLVVTCETATRVDKQLVQQSLLHAITTHLGTQGAAYAGVTILDDLYNAETQQAVLKVAHTAVNHVSVALGLIQTLGDQQAVVHVTGVSGILKKAKQYLS